MTPKLPEACSHVFRAIAEIETYIDDLADRDIVADLMRRRAIERCVAIISEAVRYIPEPSRRERPEISWRAIAGVGNILRHDYYDVDVSLILRLARTELTPLKIAIEHISPVALR